MIHETLMIVGPGGIGKSPLEDIIRADAVRVDPYRLRHDGPRNPDEKGEKDLLYAHPKLRDEIYLTFQRLGLGLTCLSQDVHWFPQAMTLFLKVWTDWQVLFLEGLDGHVAKAEIYAPVVPILLDNPQIRRVFGKLSMVVLNPVGKLQSLTDLGPLKEATRQNCRKREGLKDEEPDSGTVKKRMASVDEEAAAWREMIELNATECANWSYPEYRYQTGDRKKLLADARKEILEHNPALKVFFKEEHEIKA